MSVSVSYKEEHESFVSNLKGSSIGCIIVCLMHVPVFILTLKLVQRYKKPTLMRDFLILVFPSLLVVTVFANYNYVSLVALTIILCLVMRSLSQCKHVNETVLSDVNIEFVSGNHKDELNNGKNEENIHQRTSYITIYKGCTMLLTCISILAVDFRVFPRRFGKTETFGVSLMDLGVGLFVIGSAITSKYARGISTKGGATCNGSGQGPVPSFQRFFLDQSVSNGVVLLIGFGRLLLLKWFNYHEHVSEYGSHWNFFTTLFCVWVVADCVHRCVSRRWLLWMAGCMLLFYQWMLSRTKLTHFILSAPRTTLFSANREGIVSLLGYIPMYLIAEGIAHVILFDKGRLTVSDHKKQSSGNLNSHSDCKMINDSSLAIVEVDPFLLFSGSATGVSSDSEDIFFGKKDAFDSSTTGGTVGSSSSGSDSDLVKRVWDSQLVKNMAMTTLLLWALWMAGSTVQPTSRRLVNLTYVALCLFVSNLLLLSFYVVDKLGDIVLHKHLAAQTIRSSGSGSSVPSTYPYNGPVKPITVVTLSYLSRYGLAVFLAANVLTGCVNTTMRTIYATTPVALLVLTVYSLAVTGLAWNGRAMYVCGPKFVSLVRRCIFRNCES